MKIKIAISEVVENNQRTVHLNDELSHHLSEEVLQDCLKESIIGPWKHDETAGRELGTRLWQLFNGNGGQLQSLMSRAYTNGEPLHLYFHFPYQIDTLPLELLNNGSFIALKSNTHIIRQVSELNLARPRAPKEKPLKLVFMACSPEDLKDATLAYEEEEELILKNIEKYPIDMVVEDSGSLEGLGNTIFETGGADVVHLSGHAGIDHALGPVFYMEDELGRLDKVTPKKLWEVLQGNYAPALLFLSGCSTGKSDKMSIAASSEEGLQSFAHQMVAFGCPIVLGWGLPVSDKGATAFTAVLYGFLAKGQHIDFALQGARQAMESHYHPWPLMRAFTDGATLEALVAKGQKLRKSQRGTTYKYLQDTQVKVLEYGFIGRRREIQQGLKVLKGLDDDYYGLLVHGPAGVGKSALVGKLIERTSPRKELLVFHGELRKADLLAKCRELFNKKGTKEGIAILDNSDISYDEKIADLFRKVFTMLPTLIYWDDFEQNLERVGDEYVVKKDFLEIVKSFLSCFHWAEGDTNVVITSRYPFVMEVGGKNIGREHLLHIPLMSFSGASLEKKKKGLIHIDKSPHTALYMEVGKGNPRLLEWLDIIAEKEDQYNLEELKKVLNEKQEEYINVYLAEILAKTEGEDFLDFLHHAAVYRAPVPATAFGNFGGSHLLEKGVNLTLMEAEKRLGAANVFWVTPVIRQQEWDKLSLEEKTATHLQAYQWYDSYLTNLQEKAHHTDWYEAVHHALESNALLGACKYGVHYADFLANNLLYHERLAFLVNIANYLQNLEDWNKKVISTKNEHFGIFLNNLGLAYKDLGKADKAVDYFEKSLKIDLRVYGNTHPAVAIRYNNLGSAYMDLGDVNKAVDYFEKSLKIDLRVYGNTHPAVATRYNNLGLAYKDLGKADKAVDYFKKALRINEGHYGENHIRIATDYNNLGLGYMDLGKADKAESYFMKAFEILLKLFGEIHPLIADSYNNLGSAYMDLGNANKAVKCYKKAFDIDLKIYGKIHPAVAIRYNNLGSAFKALGEVSKAVEYFEEALGMFEAIYGKYHPNIAVSNNNLGSAYQDLGDPDKALQYYQKALEILLKLFGEIHPYTASSYNNLGSAYQDLGDADKAIKYCKKALKIDLSIYGKKHPNVALRKYNLGVTYVELKDVPDHLSLAKNLLQEAYQTFLQTLWAEHPHTQICKSWLDHVEAELGKSE